jgi:hypothetical protein
MLNAQTAITAITVTNQNATTGRSYTDNGASYAGTPFTTNTYNYTFGTTTVGTNNFRLVNQFNIGGTAYNYVTGLNSVTKLRRVNNAVATNNRSIIFAQRNSTGAIANGGTVAVIPAYQDNMEAVFDNRSYNIGTDNLFTNTGNTNSNNIERLDVIFSPFSSTTPNEVGFAVFERGSGDEFKIAAITNINPATGQPTAYGNLVSVTVANFGNNANPYEFVVLGKESNESNLRLSFVSTATQNVRGVFLNLTALGVSSGQKIYGYSLFGNDITTVSHTLTDVNTFPTATTDASGGGMDLIAITGIAQTATGVISIDSDNDGIADNIDIDDDNDGIIDTVEGTGDTDGDTVPNNLDLDSDGDGISDIIEASANGTNPDPDENGRFGTDTSPPIVGANGLYDPLDAAGGLTPPNTDGLTEADYLDLDSDEDGIFDLNEAKSTNFNTDLDFNGIVDGLADVRGVVGNITSTPYDTDNDNIADYRDSNGGTIENCSNGIDDDGDGFVDFYDTDCACADGNFFGRCTEECTYTAGFSTFAFEAQWNSVDDVPTYNTPLVADLDRDGVPEVIAMTTDNIVPVTDPRRARNLRVINGATGVTKSNILTPFMAWVGPTPIAIGNVDNDPEPEIIIATIDNASNTGLTIAGHPGTSHNGFLFCYEHDGKFKWKSNVQYGDNAGKRYGSSVGIADFNQDGIPEVYVYNEIYNAQTGVRLIAGGANGLAQAGNYGFGAMANPVAADLTTDAGLELACGNTVYEVSITNTSGTAGNSMTPIIRTGEPDGFTSLADIDNDGALDVVVNAHASGRLYIWNPRTNTTLSGVSGLPVGTSCSLPFIGDVDNDNQPEIGVIRSGGPYSGFTNPLLMFEYAPTTLTLKWGLTTSDGSGFTYITMFDFNQDGNYELVYRDESDLRIIDGKGTSAFNITTIPCFSGTGAEGPVVADVDGDGAAEICVTCGNGTFADRENATGRSGKVRLYQSPDRPWAPARKLWNQYGYNVVNVNDDLTIPRQQQNHATAFSAGIPLNNFLVQATLFDKDGSFVFPSSDASISINTATLTGTNMVVNFDIINTSIAKTALAPNLKIALFNGNPNAGGTLLGTYSTPSTPTVIFIAPGSTYNVVHTIAYAGAPFTLYMVVNNDGATIPIAVNNYGQAECDYTNNIDNATIGDTDGDGIADNTDIDDDNDGILDTAEGIGTNPGADSDADNIPNYLDKTYAVAPAWALTDINNDGVVDYFDKDLDGIPNHFDLDSDNDGINDLMESGIALTLIATLDTDSNGVLDGSFGINGYDDAVETVVDNGTPNYTLSNVDNDGTTTPDFLDLDADNDGINDLDESGYNLPDTNNDGVVDGEDADGDGLLDNADGNSAAFGDTSDTTPRNTDNDTVPDFRDLDSDNDGINDVRENNGTDADNDGLIDGATDTDDDGILDPADGSTGIYGDANQTDIDTDNDGVPDARDLDSDNDGINDVREAFTADNDTDNNGIYDGTDGADNDGIVGTADAMPAVFGDSGDPTPTDTDTDGVADFRDLDSDNDSLNDIVENGNGSLDTNTDGIIDGTDPDEDGILGSADANPTNFGDNADPDPLNSDGADNPNYRDLDSDNDSTFDIHEPGANGSNPLDGNSDGIVDNTADPDGDGIVGGADGDPAMFGDNGDTDGDGILNSVDLDDDNDGILDTTEGGGTDPSADADADGIPNFADATFAGFTDSNADGINDNFDKDLDGIPNHLDLDSDNDGINDLRESGLTATQILTLDANSDGVMDGPFGVNGFDDGAETVAENGTPIYSLANTDSDSAPDFLDLDSDNDGINDVRENNGTDTNGDGLIDGTDSDGDGIRDAADANDTVFGEGVSGDPIAIDTDSDGVADFRDLDADNDGINDVRENGNASLDTNNDGKIDASDTGQTDVDGDGIFSGLDGNTSTFGDANDTPPANADGDGVANFRDLDSDNDGINDVRENNGTDADNNGIADGNDADGDGILSSADGTVGFGDNDPTPPVNTDGDIVADYLDLDSDNDGINDVRENNGTDTNNDGIADGTDADNDGIVASADNSVGFGDNEPTPLIDTDGDTVPDFRDLDSDNDSINDVVENGGDTFDANNDGVLDGADVDGDGIKDNVDGNDVGFGDANDTTVDTDNDGIRDDRDLDSDNDGINDVRENNGTDANNDGIADGADGADGDGIVASADSDNATFGDIGDTSPPNTDGDSVPDYRDLDSDNDSLNDVTENGGTDANGDGLIDGGDADQDGIRDAADGNDGTFGEGIGGDTAPLNTDGTDNPDYRDLNSNNDAENDIDEACGSVGCSALDNGPTDGIIDNTTDGDGDGIVGGADGNPAGFGDGGDTDGDGILDTVDIDDDNDGMRDIDEGLGTNPSADADGDGILNYADTDFAGFDDLNSDGINDDFDRDLDGIPNHLDLDSDNDGITDLRESGVNTALDTDNDGILNGAVGTNGYVDGVETVADNGTPNYTILNTDGDGANFPDFLDLDSDNDGITDLRESGYAGLDANNDGVVDGADTDNDGLQDSIDGNDTLFGEGIGGDTAPVDTDGDTVLDFRDLDSDNDGINDVREAGLADPDGNGLAGTGAVPTINSQGKTGDATSGVLDTDGDGVFDFRDLDSDNDGINDVRESNNATFDTNDDGKIDTGDGATDADADGIFSGVDGVPGTRGDTGDASPINTDGDSVADYRDLDSDNDSINDVIEAFTTDNDTDNNGIYDGSDADGDGIVGSADLSVGFGDIGDPAPINTDPDTVPDYRDLDSDNDGINDVRENNGTDGDNDGKADGTDADGDGILSSADTSAGFGETTDTNPINTDGDSVADFRDLDSDNDGLNDVREGFNTDNDTDDNGLYDGTDADGDGIVGTADGSGSFGDTADPSPTNTDGDTVADFRDLDSDNDSINDVVEGGNSASDINFDGKIDANDGQTDADNDGIFSGVDGSGTYGDATDPDLFDNPADADAIPDFRDLNSNDDNAVGGTFDDIDSAGNSALDGNGDGRIDDTTDTDNDGIVGNADGNPTGFGDSEDADGDGINNGTDIDADNDGIPNAVEGGTSADKDGDGIPNYLDLDSDNDGIADVIEAGGIDTNGDGRVDFSEVNANLADADDDGLIDNIDQNPAVASPNNATSSELTNGSYGGIYPVGNAIDRDGDGVPDFLDIDADNDGILDVAEAGGTDTNNDGRLDFFGTFLSNDTDRNGWIDSKDGGNGGTSALTTTGTIGSAPTNYVGIGNTDNDAVPNFRDLDSDNDGINDVTEAFATKEDFDDDALIDSSPVTVDGDGRAIMATSLVLDTDTDGIPDFKDLDSDNDGINDVREYLATSAGNPDSDNDGIIGSGFTDTDGDGILEGLIGTTSIDGNVGAFGDLGATEPQNTDGDIVADFRDLDSDNDGLNDIRENNGTDSNGDGLADGDDADGDGIRSSADGSVGFGDASDPISVNTDGDVVPDYRDLDSDNDGINDVREGLPSNVNIDTNNDGLADGTDTDGDGLLSSADGGIAFGDANDNTPHNTDGDGVADFRDLDSDNDGINDVREAYTNGVNPDSNGDGIIGDGTFTDSDADGILEGLISGVPVDGNIGTFGDTGDTAPTNTDTDTVPDYRDLDSDNDSINDVTENGGTDANIDGIADGTDADNDGILSSADNNGGGFGDTGDAQPADTEGTPDGIPSYRDRDSDGDGIDDVDEAGNSALDGDNDGDVDGTSDADGDGILTPVDANDTAFGESTGGPLPVTFVGFTANIKAEKVHLEWITTEERNNLYFKVERSQDAKDFEVIGRVDAKAQNSAINHYEFWDNIPFKGVSYYRITQVDIDNKQTSTRIESVWNSPETAADVFPNPARTATNIKIQSEQADRVTIQIADIKGKLLLTKIIDKPIGELRQEIDLKQFPAGVYLVQVRATHYFKIFKVVKE